MYLLLIKSYDSHHAILRGFLVMIADFFVNLQFECGVCLWLKAYTRV